MGGINKRGNLPSAKHWGIPLPLLTGVGVGANAERFPRSGISGAEGGFGGVNLNSFIQLPHGGFSFTTA